MPVMEQNWGVTRITRENKDKAWRQLGTSGSGNHFVEFGLLSLSADDAELGLEAGEYVALLSHSGSRGTGASVCSTYSAIARARLPKKYDWLGRLAWLDLDSEAGQEYWAAMNLMGDYAAANHDVIHRLISKLLGAKIIAGVENHHNFAWKEMHGGREVIVHRKGATPAGSWPVGRHSRLDGRSGLRRSRSRMCRKPELSVARSRPQNVAHRGQKAIHLAGCAKESGSTRRQSPLGRRRRGAGRLQKHRRRRCASSKTWSKSSLVSIPKSSRCAVTAARLKIDLTARPQCAPGPALCYRSSPNKRISINWPSLTTSLCNNPSSTKPHFSSTRAEAGLKANTPAVSFVRASCSNACRMTARTTIVMIPCPQCDLPSQ